MSDKKYLLSTKQVKALENSPSQPDVLEINVLWDKLKTIDVNSYIKIIVDTESNTEIAKELEARWYGHTQKIVSIIKAPLPPVASYLKTVRKIEIASLDYLIVIAQPSTWEAILKRLDSEPNWNADKLIVSSNSLQAKC